MPTYLFRCPSCDTDTEENYPIGTARRIIKCVCGRPARLVIGAGVQIGASCTPTKSGDVLATKRRERAFEQDGPAYKRMRARGLQPDHIDGCARLEDTAGDQDDIDYGRAIAKAGKHGGKARVIEAVQSIETTHGEPINA